MAGRIAQFATVFLLALPAAANELRVDPRSVRVGESLVITVVLEGSFATADAVEIPVENLSIDSEPSVASEFQWINGRTSRRKVFRYAAHALREGNATAGPIRLIDDEGRRVDLPAVRIDVRDDADVSPSETAGVAVEVEASTTHPWAGQQVVVTWYAAAGADRMRRASLVEAPALDDFWVEEIPLLNAAAVDVVGDPSRERVAIRRAAIFPLRAGSLVVSPVVATIEIVEPLSRDSILPGVFEGEMTSVRRRSPTLTLEVLPVPPATRLVGTLELRCDESAGNGQQGAIVVSATLSGSANLRGASAPSWSRAPDASIEIQDLGTEVERAERGITMRRRWRYFLFPRREGAFVIPALEARGFDPATGSERIARCGERTVVVSGEQFAALQQGREKPAPPRSTALWVGGALAVVLLTIAGAVAVQKRERRIDDQELRSVAQHGSEPRTARRALHEIVTKRSLSVPLLYEEASERGDAFRALGSLLDVLEKEPWRIPEPDRELQLRVREFLKRI